MSPCSKNTRLALLLASRGWVSCWLFAMPRRVAALGAEVPRCCGPLALLQPELLACWDGETCAISPQHSRPKKIWSFLLQDQISTQVLEEAGPVAAPCQGDASLCRLAPAGRSPLSCRSLLSLLGAAAWLPSCTDLSVPCFPRRPLPCQVLALKYVFSSSVPYLWV